MRLISCYIENFGKLSNVSFDFEKDITSINEENGFGKTTLSVFIKSMFYGLDYKRKKELYDRTRYLPWNNLKCGGYLIFEINETVYRIERTFGKTNKTDTFNLYNEKTHTTSYDYSENIGEEIWGVDKESFENTAFINLKDDSNLLTEIISSKLNDSTQTQNIDEYQKTYDLLDKKATELYSKRGNKGLIPQKQDELNLYKRQLLDCDINEREIERINKQIKIIDEDIKDTEKDINGINPKSKPNNNADLIYIDELLDNYNKSCHISSQIENLEFKLQMIQNSNLRKQKKLKTNNIIFIISFILLLLSIVSVFFSLLIAVGLFMLFLIMIGFSLYGFSNIKKELKQNEADTVKNQIEQLKTQKDFLDDTYKEFIIRYIPNDNLENIVKSLSQIKYNLQNQDSSSFNSDNELLFEKLSKLKADKLILKNKIDSLSEKLEQKEDIISNIDNLSEQIDVLQDRYETLIDTMKYLEIARQNLASKYIGGIEKGFLKYLEKLGSNDLDKLKIDINLDVKIEEQGQLYKSDYLSLGSNDLVNFCIRMALIESVFNSKEKPILILDDPFANLDEQKLEKATQLLKNISKEYQIIYFTCHSSREIL